MLDNHLLGSECFGCVEHGLADVIQTLDVVPTAVVCAVEIRSFIVAGNIDDRLFHAVEHSDGAGLERIDTLGTTILDLATYIENEAFRAEAGTEMQRATPEVVDGALIAPKREEVMVFS